MKVVTHSGRFHADEVFALAMLARIESLDIERSRDPEVIEAADMVLDVGHEYAPEQGRFDHHQNSFTLTRDNAIPYATAGLVWHHFAEPILAEAGLTLAHQQAHAKQWVDQKLIQDVDAVDNGLYNNEPRPTVSMILGMMNASATDALEQQQAAFKQALACAEQVLAQFIQAAVKEAQALDVLQAALAQTQEGIMVLDETLPYKDFIRHHPEVKRVVYPKGSEGYGVYCNQSENHLPPKFRGLRGADLAEVSGLDDAVFCHKSGFMCVMGSFDSAMAMARS